MGAQTTASVSHQVKISGHSLSDYLSFRDIEMQYPRCVTAGTLAVWASTHRYAFHLLITKIGRNSRIRRDRWEQFLDERTIGQGSLSVLGGAEDRG